MGKGEPRQEKKKNGYPYQEICSCGYLNCDNAHGFMRTPYIRKLHFRQANKLCIACGQKICQCKNKGRKPPRRRV